MIFDFQPVLQHPSVHLRAAQPDDWEPLFAAASDPAIWSGHPASDRWREPVFRAFFDEGMSCGGMLIATEPETGAIIGTSRFDTARAQAGEIEIGWTFLARKHWGGTVNPVMKALMAGHALRVADRVIFLIGASNGRSRAAITRLGARLTPRTVMANLSTGPVEHMVYAIDRDGFAEGPLAAHWAEHIQ